MSIFSTAITKLLGDTNMAVDALYTLKTGDPLTVRVSLSRPDELSTFSGTPLVAPSFTIVVAIASIPDLKTGETFEIEAVTYRVEGTPLRDVEGVSWSAGASIV